MKDTYNFPKTLRNYDENNTKMNSQTLAHHSTKIQKSMSSSNFKYPKIVEEQNHEIGDYYVLTNPSQFKSKQNKKKSKSKSKKFSSRLSQALKDQLSKPLMTLSQIGPQNIVHCKSLEKLQIISNDRSQEIKVLIQQKAYLIAQNQELKAKLVNPTFREQEFIQKISQREYEIENLKENLKRKEQRIQQIQKDHKLEIQRLKNKHREEITGLREQMNKLRLNKIQSGKTYNTTASYEPPPYNKTIQSQQPQIYRLSDPKASQLKTTYYRSGQLTTLKQDNQPQYLQSDTYKSSMKTVSQDKSPLRQTSNKNDSSLPYRTFVGEDGYERRVYTVNKENDALKVSSQTKEVKTTVSSTSSLQSIQPIRYLNSNVPFTNEKITSNIRTENLASQSPFVTSSYTYQQRNSEQGNQKESNLHNQILYSKSLTFQCFNDPN